MTYSAPVSKAASARLTVAGAVHGDPHGYERAWKLLDFVRPDLISVEISPFSLHYRRRREKYWLKQLSRALAGLPESARDHLALKRLEAQIRLPFEARAARDWGRAFNIPWRAVDLGELSRRHLPFYSRELLSPDNLKSLLSQPNGSMEEYVREEFQRARMAWEHRSGRLPGLDHRGVLNREGFLARRLRHLAARGRVVHLGGWEHLVSWQDGQGLWPWLADLHPARLLLEDADLLPDQVIS
jgi:hypothetical protein